MRSLAEGEEEKRNRFGGHAGCRASGTSVARCESGSCWRVESDWYPASYLENVGEMSRVVSSDIELLDFEE